MNGLIERLEAAAAERRAAGLQRRLHPRAQQEPGIIDLASNDYLGLSGDPRVKAAAESAVQRWGAGATGSRLVTGSTTLHAELEANLAAHVGSRSALVLSSGYMANLAVVSSLARPDSLVVSDALNHASIVDACRLSRAEVAVVPHRDPAAVDRVLAARTQPVALVVTDAIFSVDGDLAPLAELHQVTRRHGAVLVVDEAHSLGVVGDGGIGAVAAAGLAGEHDIVLTLTLSKSLGGQGGAVAGSELVIDHLVNHARPFIFDTGLAPASVGAALSALRILQQQPGLAKEVRAWAVEIAKLLADAGWPAPEPAAAVISAPVGSAENAVAAARFCGERGVRVGCFRPPSVPDGISRLRLTAHATLTHADLERVAEVLGEARGFVDR